MTEGNQFPPPPPTDPNAGSLPYQTPGGSGYPGPYVGPAPTKDDQMMGMLAHLLSIFLGFLGPLIIWLIKKDTSPFVDDQGKEALNFNITVAIACFALVLLSIVTIGIGLIIAIPAWIVIGIGWLVLTIIAAVKSSNGEFYRYPMTLRLVK